MKKEKENPEELDEDDKLIIRTFAMADSVGVGCLGDDAICRLIPYASLFLKELFILKDEGRAKE